MFSRILVASRRGKVEPHVSADLVLRHASAVSDDRWVSRSGPVGISVVRLTRSLDIQY